MAAPEDQAVLIVLHATFHCGAQVAGDGRVGIGVVKVDGDGVAHGAGVPVIHGTGEGFAAARARRVVIQHIGVFAAGAQVEGAVFATGHQGAVALRVCSTVHRGKMRKNGCILWLWTGTWDGRH